MRLLSLLALFCFGLSIIVHFSTYFSINTIDFTFVALFLNVISLVLIVAMIITRGQSSNRDNNQNYMELIPTWIKFVLNAFFIYAIINVLIFFLFVGNTTLETHDSKYFLSHQGSTPRELTVQEYHQQQALKFRGLSGHWMAFFLLQGLYFWYGKSTAVEED